MRKLKFAALRMLPFTVGVAGVFTRVPRPASTTRRPWAWRAGRWPTPTRTGDAYPSACGYIRACRIAWTETPASWATSAWDGNSGEAVGR